MKSQAILALFAATVLAGAAGAQTPQSAARGQSTAGVQAGEQLHIQMDAAEQKLRAAMQSGQIDRTTGDRALQTLMRIRSDDSDIRSRNAGRVSDIDRGRLQQRIDDLNQEITTAQRAGQARNQALQDANGRPDSRDRSDQYAGRDANGDQTGRRGEYRSGEPNGGQAYRGEAYGRAGGPSNQQPYPRQEPYTPQTNYGRADASGIYARPNQPYDRYQQGGAARGTDRDLARGAGGIADPRARLDRLERRVREGVADGSLSRSEARRARIGLRSIRNLQSSLLRRHHGVLTNEDQLLLQSRLDRLRGQVGDLG